MILPRTPDEALVVDITRGLDSGRMIPPVFFRCWKLTLWGPRVLGPPQLGVVADGNATMGRPTLLLPVLGKVGSPRSARVAPPRWG